MKTTNEQIKFYVNVVNELQETKISVHKEYGRIWIKTDNGNQIIFGGTKGETFNFLLGLARFLQY